MGSCFRAVIQLLFSGNAGKRLNTQDQSQNKDFVNAAKPGIKVDLNLDGHVLIAEGHHDVNGWEVAAVLVGLNRGSHSILEK